MMMIMRPELLKRFKRLNSSNSVCVCDDNDRFIGLKYCLIDDKFVAAASAVVVVDDDYQSNEQKWWNFFLPQIFFLEKYTVNW